MVNHVKPVELERITLRLNGQLVVFSNAGYNRFGNVAFHSTNPDVGLNVVMYRNGLCPFSVNPCSARVKPRADLLADVRRRVADHFTGL